MAGIAFVIPNSDFSESPLGQVTFKKNVNDLVSAYAENIGTHDYDEALKTMLRSLNVLGLLESMDIYPMFGSTLNLLKLNLLPKSNVAETEWQGRELVFGANALANEDYVQLDATTQTGTVTYHDVSIPTSESPYVFTDVRIGTNNSVLYTNRDSTNLLIGSSNQKPRLVARGVDQVVDDETVTGRRVRLAVSVQSASQKVYVDEVGYENTSTGSLTSLSFTDVLGPKSTSVCGAYVRFFAKGLVPASKVESVNTIFKTFLDAVKPRA